MATKPVTPVTQWATDTNYAAGPDIGTPTKVDCSSIATQGHIAGETNPTAAQHMNDWQNEVSQLCEWVEAGSAAGAADAHIVETDLNGYTSLAMLEILGNGSLGPASLEVTRQGSTPQAALFTNGSSSISIGNNGATQLSISAATGLGAYEATVSGNAVPMRLAPQLTKPVVSVAHDGGIGFETVALSGDDAFRMYAVANGSKKSVAMWEYQFVRRLVNADGPFDFNGDVSSRTTLIGPFNFNQWGSPQTGSTPLVYTISLEYSSASSTADMWVALYNNGTLVRRHFLSLHGEVTIQQGHVRGLIPGALDFMNNSFTVEAYKVVGGGTTVHVENVICVIETTN